MGIAVNRPVDGMSIADLLKRLEIKATIEPSADLVLLGGPVERERGFVLHTGDYAAGEHSMAINEEVSLTATRDVLEAMGGAGAPPRRALLALGYAGWGPGQLEREIRENVWLTCAPDESLIFDGDHDRKWNKALAKLGVDASLLSATAGRA